MPPHAKTFILLLLALILGVAKCTKNVTIAKCCDFDEYLSSDAKCVRSLNNSWKIKPYSPAKKRYLKANEIPVNWHMKSGSKPSCANPRFLSADLSAYLPFQNGSLYLVAYHKLIHPLNYCIDYEAVLYCAEEPGTLQSKVEVSKCCPGQAGIFSDVKKTCIPMNGSAYGVDVGPNKTVIYGFPPCRLGKMALIAKLHETTMYDNGSLWVPESKLLFPVANYCLEHVLEHAGRSPSVIICQEHLPSVVVEPATKNRTDYRFTLYPIGLALSAVFLAATLAAGALLPASHHVLHWRCQTNHVACLLVGDVLLCITQLSGKMEYTYCLMIAVCMHFLFLAAFFWLNTMCFNIWWTFRDLRPQSVEKSQERCRLRFYEAYAWGVPLMISGTAFILDTVPSESSFLRPQFASSGCWFHGDMEILTFFFGPIGVLLVVNLALFTMTARELTCGLWKRELVKSTSERAALGRVCLKLVVVMGVTWMADVISWAVGGPHELWYVTDLINCFQGVFIFIVVGCQPQVLSAVKRLWCWRKHGENGTAGTTNHHSSSSQGLPSMGDTMTTNNSVNNTKSVPLETSC